MAFKVKGSKGAQSKNDCSYVRLGVTSNGEKSANVVLWCPELRLRFAEKNLKEEKFYF